MDSTHNKRKSVVAERFIRTLKIEIYKYMISISRNVYIDKLDNIVKKYNNTYHRTIKMKIVDVKSSTYINFNKENNKEGRKFKVGDHVRLSKHKNTFAKGYVRNWSNTIPWTYVISDINGEKIVGMFYEKELRKTIQKNLELKK